jgi:chemotaxis protein methyltransferase CheR
LIEKINQNQDFLEKIVKEITVNTTELFRDPKIWQILRYDVLKKYENEPVINIWHAGCSTGQEVYSMLILFSEMNMLDKVKMFASDLNTDVLEIASKGTYKYRDIFEYTDNYNQVIEQNPFNLDEKISVPLTKYFDVNKSKDSVKVKQFLLDKVSFSKHDLVKDGNVFNISFHIIMCRNVLIYFTHILQNKLFDFFYKTLYDNGCLVIGRHEGILGSIASKFKKKETIYIKNLPSQSSNGSDFI